MGFKKILAEAVRYALVDVQGTRVTRTGGESVDRPQLERRESFACTKHVRRVCVLPNPYGGGTHHVRIPKIGPRFCK
jgi:hypothetical protein